MHFLIFLSVLAVISNFESASGQEEKHSMCYNHFLKKDGCVYGSTCHPCPESAHPAKKSCESGSMFQHPSATQSTGPQTTFSMPNKRDVAAPRKVARVRRYDTTDQSSFVAGGNGTCGFYNTTSAVGVCIWNGPTASNVTTAETAGWLNNALPDNCNKKVYIQRQGQPDTVKFVRVLDSCGFNTDLPEVGCFQVFVTRALYDLFQPTQAELMSGSLYNITWDFAKNVTDDPQPGPI